MKKTEEKTTESKTTYDPAVIESKWQKKWEADKLYSPDLEKAKKPFFNLMMFPYPSAEGLHVGNMYAFTGTDVYARFQRMSGNDVFEPIGLDGFGIHSENYALKIGKHPMDQSKVAEKNFYRQLHATGNSFDWSRAVETYNPEYYKWTQWLFVQLFKMGLAYRKKALVNWCPSCKTVLSDEQVVNGQKNVGKTRHDVDGKNPVILGSVATPESDPGQARMTNNSEHDNLAASVCERCGTEVEKRDLEQWFFKITDYAERLLNNIPSLNWTEKVKIAQQQWIGKKVGALVKFALEDSDKYVEIFTTRPDTLFGATFLVLSPEHPLVAELLKFKISDKKLKTSVSNYVEEAKSKSDIERTAADKVKTGVFTGLYCINPVNGEKVQLWIADYALMGYGTGALFGDAHDERDVVFAKKYDIPLKPTLATGDKERDKRIMALEEVFTGYGTLVDSGSFTGLSSQEAMGQITAWLEKEGKGKASTNYHLRDWLISRQRYWGPPIPMIFCENCAQNGHSWFSEPAKSEVNSNENHREISNNKYQISNKKGKIGNWKLEIRNSAEWNSAGWYPVPDDKLPVELPYIEDYRPIGTGASPLGNHPEFYRTQCPGCGGEARRETDVSDTFLDSAWYFFRYVSTDIENNAFDIDRVKKWLPVTMYIGGAEHSVLHLLYARFITMVLKDLGLIDFEEPFSRFYAHGLIIKDGAKMSKSKGNVVVPDEYINKFGADTLRLYLQFLGPFSQGGDFRDSGIEGMHRFVKRVWTLVTSHLSLDQTKDERPKTKDQLKMMHKTIKKVTEELENLRFNTAIAAIMEYYNGLSAFYTKYQILDTKYLKTLVLLLAPFAPHMTEELWSRFKKYDSRFMNEENPNSYLVNRKSSWSIHIQPWPKFDPKFLETDEVTIVVQIDGRVRDTLQVQNSKFKVQSYVEEKALALEKIKRQLEGKKVKNVIFVPGKIINFVTE